MEAIFEFVVQPAARISDRISNLIYQPDFQKYIDMHAEQQLTIQINPTAKIADKERMYAFYHKAVLGAAIEVFTNDGWEYVDKVKADYLLKCECAKAEMFNKNTSELIIYLEDKASMNKERLHKYISDCIVFLEVERGAYIPSSESFRPGGSGFVSTRKSRKDEQEYL